MSCRRVNIRAIVAQEMILHRDKGHIGYTFNMIDTENRTDFKPDMAAVENMAAEMSDREIELVICGDDDIRDLNRQYRQIDSATDVLSFPYEPSPMAPLGSIVISADFVHRGAEKFGHSSDEEFTLLFLHGLLHLLGFDHETDDGEMRAKEEEIIRKFGLSESLIVRIEKDC